ncbi:MAG: metallophosphoesterase [Candidatus Bipolaricaulota bacterium]|nr:MAG: metallophosphoesterase [Candidatus Bipolaricaulota bacterium]
MGSLRRRTTAIATVPVLLGVLLCTPLSAATDGTLRIGIFADLHAHDTNSPLDHFVLVGWQERLAACVTAMNAWPADLMIQLGDFVNGRFVLGAELGDPERIPAILAAADAVYAGFDGPRLHVLGNHDVGDLTKDEFLDLVDVERTTLSVDIGGYHIVVLDAQYRPDSSDRGDEFWYMPGFVSPSRLAWLRADLEASNAPTIVCLHQRLDLDYEVRHGGPEVLNHLEVRDVLRADGDVIAVFQGHDHWGGYTMIDGIHYITFRSLMDRTGGVPPTWAQVTLDPVASTIEVSGEGEQEDYLLRYPGEE